MSVRVMSLAFDTDLPTTQRFVLVALADAANETGECFPSIGRLMRKTGLSDRAVQRALSELETLGHMHRHFEHGRSTTYWIHPIPAPESAEDAPRPGVGAGATLSRPRRISTPTPRRPTPDTQPPPPPTHSRPGGDRGSPITVSEPSEDPSGNHQGTRGARASAIPKPDDVTETTWSDWCALRKAKKATVSATVLKGAREEAGKAGMALEAFLVEWCTRGSQGLKASWLEPRPPAGGANAPRLGGGPRGGPRTQAEVDEINRRNTEEARAMLFGPTPQQEIFDA